MSSTTVKYFAYGSNMNPRRMEYRGARISSMKFAILEGYELVFNKLSSKCVGEGFANIKKNEYSVVEGILYETTFEGIKNLDLHEKYPFEYDRSEFRIIPHDESEIKAYAYIAQPYKVADHLKPRKEYLDHLLEARGYLSKDYLSILYNTSTLD